MNRLLFHVQVRECTKFVIGREQDKTLDENMDTEKEHDANAELNPYADLQHDIMTLESHRKDDIENDGLTDIWKEMTLAMEFSKVFTTHYYSLLA